VSRGAEVIEGLVLCRVGDDRLAVRALEVNAFEPFDFAADYAGARFSSGATAPGDGKVLRHRDVRLAVDSVEVHAERVALLPVPPVLARVWGGALTGFVEAAGQLWPVVSLERFATPPEAVS
jgi:hypothetical protein